MVHTLNRYFARDYTWQHLTVLFIAAFLVRALTFGFYVQHEERYKQADTNDYHFCAVGLKAGTGMCRVDTLQPIFWRTPGYPLYLSWFYSWFNIKTSDFSANSAAQKASIWMQIFLCSIIPLLLFFLVRSLTNSFIIAWISAWLSVIHIGYVLATCYILSDALAQIFFIGFLYFFYRSFILWFESKKKEPSSHAMFISISIAALLLALYTWIRPNGQFVVILSVIILLFGHCAWRIKFTKILLFTLIFFGGISGWYIRNYQTTGHWFFCPMSGPYLQAFCAPKIIRRISQQPLDHCMRYLMRFVIAQTKEETERLAREAPHLKVSKELICGNVARPWIIKHPWYFACDWTKEILKTTFDLYSSQLVAFANKTHTYDPLEEFLTEKIMLCLFNQPMPLLMRILCWLEFLFTLLLWIGLLCGMWLFLIKPLTIPHNKKTNETIKNQALWLKTGLLIGGMIMMTGGFGYARLRLPAEPLLIMLSLTFWYYLYIQWYNNTQKESARKYYEKPLCTMA